MTSSLQKLLTVLSLVCTVIQKPCQCVSQVHNTMFNQNSNVFHSNGLTLEQFNSPSLSQSSSSVNASNNGLASGQLNPQTLSQAPSSVHASNNGLASGQLNRPSLSQSSSSVSVSNANALAVNTTDASIAATTLRPISNAKALAMNPTDASIAATTLRPMPHGFLLEAAVVDKGPAFANPMQASGLTDHSALSSRCKLLCTSGLPCPPECLAHPSIWSDTVGKRSKEHTGIGSL